MLALRRFGHLSKILNNRALSISSVSHEFSNFMSCNIILSHSKILSCSALGIDNVFAPKLRVINDFLLSRSICTSIISCAKNKSKEKKKSKSANLDLREVNEVYNVEKLKEQFAQSVENMKQEYIKNLTLRSTSGSIELIPIKMEDKVYEIQELAQIVRSPKSVILNVNFPTAVPLIVKAIQSSGLNINPQQDGTTISLPIPKITKEYRDKLSKGAKSVYIKYRDEIKNNRSRAIKKIKGLGIGEDVIHRVVPLIEKVAEQYLNEIENILKTKQTELIGN